MLSAVNGFTKHEAACVAVVPPGSTSTSAAFATLYCEYIEPVAAATGTMYSQYKVAKAAEVLVLPGGTTATQAASCFVNPLTALSMMEVMRREGHKALVHTAAASNLGQMLNKICQRDGVSLVNIVRLSLIHISE